MFYMPFMYKLWSLGLVQRDDGLHIIYGVDSQQQVKILDDYIPSLNSWNIAEYDVKP